MAPRNTFGISVSVLKERLRDDPWGAFAFYGPEEMLKQFYLNKFQALIEKEGAEEFNLVRLDFTRDATLSTLEDEVQILPFGGEKRLIVCRGLSPATLTEKQAKHLAAILDQVDSFLILILYLESDEFEANKDTLKRASVKLLSEKMTFVSFPLQEERVLFTWSRKILASEGLTSSDRALRTLFRLAGNRMQIIRGELTKLSSYLQSQGRQEVTEEDVLLFAEDTTEFATYHLSDALIEGAVGAVEKILRNLKNQKVTPVEIASGVSRVLTAAMLLVEGADFETCQKLTRVQEWKLKQYRQSLYGKKKEDVEKALFFCLELDGKLKGYRSDAWTVLEMTLMEITQMLRGQP